MSTPQNTAQEHTRYICLNCRQQQHGNCISDGCDCICKELKLNVSPQLRVNLSPRK